MSAGFRRSQICNESGLAFRNRPATTSIKLHQNLNLNVFLPYMSLNSLSDRLLLQMLSVLSPVQRKTFRDYLQSPYFNTNQVLIQLADVLDKWLSGNQKKPLTLALVKEKVGIAESTVEKSLSLLLTHLRNFSRLEGMQSAQQSDFAPALDWICALRLDGKLLEIEYRKYAKQLASKPLSTHQIYESLNLAHSRSKMYSEEPRKLRESLFSDPILQLEQFYVVSRLKYACARMIEWRIYGGDRPTLNVDSLKQRLLDIGGQLTELGIAYEMTYSMLQADNPASGTVIQFLEYMREKEAVFSIEDTRDFYGYILNSCFRGVDLGQKEKSMLVFEVYQYMLKGGLLITGGRMKSAHFKNIVSIHMQIGKIAEAAKFISEYKHFVEAGEANSLVPYTLGVVAFYDQDYLNAIDLFRKVLAENPEDLFWGVEARLMLWKTYFEAYDQLELPDQDEMQRHYDSFRISVARNKQLSDYHKACYTNFIRIFARLFHFMGSSRDKQNARKLELLLAETRDLKEIANKGWLLRAIAGRMENNS